MAPEIDLQLFLMLVMLVGKDWAYLAV